MMVGAVLGWAIYTHGASRFGDWSPLRYTTLTALAGTVAMIAASVAADLAGWQHAPAAAVPAAARPAAPARPAAAEILWGAHSVGIRLGDGDGTA